MPEHAVRLHNPTGLHARPATTFSVAASRYTCDVQIRKGDRVVNGKSVLALLTLDVDQGDEITIITDGDGAEAALNELVALVERGLDEERE